MQTQEIRFTVTRQDYRAANYYIYFLSRIFLLRLSLAFLILFAIYLVLEQSGVLPFWEPSAYIAIAVAFWLLCHFFKIEQTVRRYARSKDNILNKQSILRFSDVRMTMKIPEKAFSSSGLFRDFPCAFETRSAFLVYTSASELFLIPRRALEAAQTARFRSILSAAMGDRFSSRHNKNAPHIPTEDEIKALAISKEKEEKEAAAKAALKEAKKRGNKPVLSITEKARLADAREMSTEKKDR